jgi:LmbE family N-acetylglucosaminyl deacetylase
MIRFRAVVSRVCIGLIACWVGVASAADISRRVLVITAHAGDYLIGAGGFLAGLIDQGYEVIVIQVTNDEKNSDGLEPAETQKANQEEGGKAARLLGARELVCLGHKSGELGYISSTELRSEIFGLVRYFKPHVMVIPDPYIHYDENRDHFYVGKMAEEAWGYSGGENFGPELQRMGLGPYGAPEVYYYAIGRPYRPGEGGDVPARFRPVDVSAAFDRKLKAVLALRTTNRLYATQTRQRLIDAGHPDPRLGHLDDNSINALVRAYLEELASTIGTKHGFRYGEEFNYVGVVEGLPEHVLDKVKPEH